MNNEENVSAQQEKTKKYVRIPKKDVHRRRAQSDQPPSSQGTQATSCLNFSFPKSARLLARRQFLAMKHGSLRFVGNALLIHYKFVPGSPTKLGLTVPKKFGSAPKRNRFKRIVREAFRKNCHNLPDGLQMNVLPKRGISDFSLASATKDLVKCAHHEPAQSPATKSR